MTSSVDQHRLAEELAAAASSAELEGDTVEAARLLRHAAELEAEAYARIPEARAKTRAIVATNAVAFLRRAGAHDEAGALARRYLAQPELPRFAEQYLLESILDSVQRREAEALEVEISPPYGIALRGGGVRAGGLVPLDLVLLKLDQFRGYALRVGEWVASEPFRRRGPVSDAISRLVVPTISPATIGSYRFNVHIQSVPAQLQAFDETTSITASTVGVQFFDIIQAVADKGPSALDQRVADAEYRDAFLRQVRTLAPSGGRLDEIEVSAPGGRRSALLVPDLKKAIQRHIDASRPRSEREAVRSGVLRAIDLDNGRLVLREAGVEQHCRIEAGMLDDVVGPLVNHRVTVTGVWRRNAFYISDIDEAAPGEARS